MFMLLSRLGSEESKINLDKGINSFSPKLRVFLKDIPLITKGRRMVPSAVCHHSLFLILTHVFSVSGWFCVLSKCYMFWYMRQYQNLGHNEWVMNGSLCIKTETWMSDDCRKWNRQHLSLALSSGDQAQTILQGTGLKMLA